MFGVVVCTGVPVAVDPEYTFTVTEPLSPAARPPVPDTVGVADFTVAPSAGAVTETTGAVVSGTVVSTVNVTALLVPTLPAASRWLAWTVYVPSPRLDKALDQEPSAAMLAVAVCAGAPVAVEPV
jgi:hypothetical protein